MTAMEAKKKEKHRKREIAALFESVAFTALIFLTAIFFSDELSDYVAAGLKISVRVIIPSVFPFLVLTDASVRFIRFERIGRLRRLFERAFHINGAALPVFVCGVLCGFPLGAKLALTMYENGKISKCECERLMCFSNIASPAYTVSAVGIGILSNFKVGLILYFVSLFSTVATGFLTGIKKRFSRFSGFTEEQNYDLVKSIKKSAAASVNVIFFISFFSAISVIIKLMPISEAIKFIVMPFIEVGSAVKYLSDSCIFSFRLTLAAIAFSLSFSGLSVIMQSLALEGAEEISRKKCFLYKLLQGLISFLIILALPI